MRNKTLIAALAAAVMALGLVGWLGAGGTAATRPAGPSKQELARRLWDRPGVQLTPAARTFLTKVAAGGAGRGEPEGAEPRARTQVATTAAGSAVGVAGPGLRNVRVNDPAADRHQQDQTTQSETTIAVVGRNVAVGYNDSQQSLLVIHGSPKFT